jgi:acetyl-CoA carboxylase biotin carboxyl carrier protein
MDAEKETSWLERVEAFVHVLEGSTVSEFELTEGDTAITIRRAPQAVLVAAPTIASNVVLTGVPQANSTNGHVAPTKKEQKVPIPAPLTGVYYASASPTTPPFVNVGDTVHVGQVIALIEAMKVFNEITAETSGRVVDIAATSGTVVQKGDAILHVEPV